MARAATGTVAWDEARKIWRGRVTLVDGARPWVDCPDGLPNNDRGRDRAREWILERTQIARAENLRGTDFAIVRRSPTRTPPQGETVSGFYVRYYKAKEDRGDSSVRDARGRFKTHIQPLIGHLLMSEVTTDKLEDVRDFLDREVREGRMSWKTGLNTWNEVTSPFRQATSSKDRSLRVLAKNPADGIAPPDKGDEREKPFLFPDEVTKLLSCTGVPVYRRACYAVGIFTGARSSELEALTAADVDLEHQQIMIARQADRDDRSKDAKTKTRVARPIELEPALAPLLEVLVKECPEGRLHHLPPPEDRAEKLREDLAQAGCDREALTADDESRAPMKFHNLRDTCLTHMVARKDDPWRVQARARHSSIAMTQKYIGEQGTRVGAAFGTPFPPIPSSLIEAVKTLGSRHGSKAPPARSVRGIVRRGVRATKAESPSLGDLGSILTAPLGDPNGTRRLGSGVQNRRLPATEETENQGPQTVDSAADSTPVSQRAMSPDDALRAAAKAAIDAGNMKRAMALLAMLEETGGENRTPAAPESLPAGVVDLEARRRGAR